MDSVVSKLDFLVRVRPALYIAPVHKDDSVSVSAAHDHDAAAQLAPDVIDDSAAEELPLLVVAAPDHARYLHGDLVVVLEVPQRARPPVWVLLLRGGLVDEDLVLLAADEGVPVQLADAARTATARLGVGAPHDGVEDGLGAAREGEAGFGGVGVVGDERVGDDVVGGEDVVEGLGDMAEEEDGVPVGEVVGDCDEELCREGFEGGLPRGGGVN